MNINDVALRRLGTRNRTVWELTNYLCEKSFPRDEVEQLIEEFVNYGYLDDYKYCQEYFRYAFGKGKGKRKVFMELSQKGVGDKIIEKAFDEYEGEYDEEKMAKKEANKILLLAEINGGEAISDKILAKIARRLISKGYSSDVVYRIIGGLKK